MAYQQGINFRATLAYVTDGANDSFENSNSASGTGSYPRTTAQGNTVGWETANSVNIRDRSTSVDPRLAGINFFISTQNDFRFDLPSAGSYNIRAAFGDMSSVNDTLWTLLDTTTLLATMATGNNSASGSFKDATDTVRTAAAWPGSNAAITKTFTTTICRFRSSAAGAANLIAHAYVESAGGATNTQVTPGASAVTVAGFAPTLTRTANQSLAPGASSVGIIGYAPTISQPKTITANAGTLAITGYALTLAQTANKNVSPSSGALMITGYAPTVSRTSAGNIIPVTSSLAIIGFAPTITKTANQNISPNTGILAITGFNPIVHQGLIVSAPIVAQASPMRGTNISNEVIELIDSIAASSNKMSGTKNETTVMRATFIANTSTMRDNAINQIVEFI